jgi:superfamily I DNA and RNA helicase
LENEEIEEDDILIILTDPLTGQKESNAVMTKLLDYNLKSHIVGVTSDIETVFIEKSIAISSIYRAKWNEAPLVDILNSQSCFDGIELSKKRNILFTAITRSRAWVNILGYNEVDSDMSELCEEVQKVIDKDFVFEFTVKGRNRETTYIHKDRTPDSRERIKEGKEFKKFLDGLDEAEKNLVGCSRNSNE